MSDQPRMLRDGEGDVLGSPQSCTDRFMIEGSDTGGAPEAEQDTERIAEPAAQIACDVDEAAPALVARHGLRF